MAEEHDECECTSDVTAFTSHIMIKFNMSLFHGFANCHNHLSQLRESSRFIRLLRGQDTRITILFILEYLLLYDSVYFSRYLEIG